MFTGIVEELGSIVARVRRGPGARLTIGCAMPRLALGESIAVSGVCLTVDRVVSNGFEADASMETLDRTTLGALSIGAAVNLERALLPTTRLGGHLVGGHVDAIGQLLERIPVGEAIRLKFSLPSAIAALVAGKGSIAIEGVSLTVNVVGDDTFEVAIIPHTFGRTTLSTLVVGAKVNLEADVMARYVARWLSRSPRSDAHEVSTPETSAPETSMKDETSLLGALTRAGYT